VASPTKGQSSERQSSHPATTASGRLKTVTNLELDNKAKTQPTIRKPTLAGYFSGPRTATYGNSPQTSKGWNDGLPDPGIRRFTFPLPGIGGLGGLRLLAMDARSTDSGA
jgi:hypothetical protein